MSVYSNETHFTQPPGGKTVEGRPPIRTDDLTVATVELWERLDGFLFVGGIVWAGVNLARSLFGGPKAPDNPWGAATMEWQCSSPPPHDNFSTPPEVDDCYDYDNLQFDEQAQGYVKIP